MTAPSIKEALEFYADRENYSRQLEPMPCGCCSDWLDARIEVDEGDMARAALASLQPDGERREAIARIIDPDTYHAYDIHKKAGTVAENGKPWADVVCGKDIAAALAKADLILASGLVQNEAGILKAMEQECWTLRCVDIPTGGGDADVGWEVIQHHQAKPHERMIAHGRTPQEALNAAIRSARDGGAET